MPPADPGRFGETQRPWHLVRLPGRHGDVVLGGMPACGSGLRDRGAQQRELRLCAEVLDRGRELTRRGQCRGGSQQRRGFPGALLRPRGGVQPGAPFVKDQPHDTRMPPSQQAQQQEDLLVRRPRVHHHHAGQG